MHQWYVVHTLSAHEKKVKKALEDQRDLKGMTDFIENVLLPVENVSEVKKGQQKIFEHRVFTRFGILPCQLRPFFLPP